MYNPDNDPPFNPHYQPPPYQKDNYAPPPYSIQQGHPPYPEPPPPVGFYPSQPYGAQAQPFPSMAVPVGYQPIIATDPNPQPPNDVPINEDVESHFGSTFSDKEIRRKFVRKVYSILVVQLLFTFGIVALFVFERHVQEFVQKNMIIYIISYVTLLVTYFVLVCCQSVRRQFPGNLICLAVFTLAMTYVAAAISSFHETSTVMIAAGICAGTCLVITLFSMWTKFDFTGFGPYLYIACWVLVFFGIACIFTYREIMMTVYSGLGALLMMLFLAYNTQMIMGGRKHEISPEEYISGALQLYVDIVYMFLFLLRLVGSSK